jgi:hypothetical protein
MPLAERFAASAFDALPVTLTHVVDPYVTVPELHTAPRISAYSYAGARQKVSVSVNHRDRRDAWCPTLRIAER